MNLTKDEMALIVDALDAALSNVMDDIANAEHDDRPEDLEIFRADQLEYEALIKKLEGAS